MGQIIAPFQHRKDKPLDYEQRKVFYLNQAAEHEDKATL